MSQHWLLFFLASVPGWVLSQVQLQESGPSLVAPSQTLSLTCSVSGFSLTSYHVHWVRQAPGKGLDWIGVIWNSGGTKYKPSLQSRLSITRDTSKSQVYLKLSSSVIEDTAVYYCARDRRTGTGSFDIWGQGTPVTVSSVSQKSPTVFPLTSINEDKSENVFLGCLVRDFFPLPTNVSWASSGMAQSFPEVQGANGLYTMSSQLQLPAEQCQDKVECQVQHAGLTMSVDVRCPDKCIKPPSLCDKPRVSLLKPALEDLLLGLEANLTCTLSGLQEPEGATFTWTSSSGKDAVQGSPQRDACGCYSVSSYLPGCADPWNRGEIFSCTAKHPEAPEPLTATISKSQEGTFPPLVHLLQPPSEEVGLNELVTLTCLIRGFRPKDVLVLWLHENRQLPREDFVTWSSVPEPGQGGTYTVSSTLRVDAEVWRKGDSFSCLVGHEALPQNFTQKTINRLMECQNSFVCEVLDLPPGMLEDTPGASLWSTTVTLLTLFLLSLFYSTALTMARVRGHISSKEVPQY